MRIIDSLKQKNRTVLEMYLGIVFWGMVCEIVGSFWTKDLMKYTISLWLGIVLAMISTLHMYRSLDNALELDEKSASKLIYRSYMIRYISLTVILSLIMITEVLNPLVVFGAYMGLKVAALLQPITHKFCNKLFHETDPVPQALPEEEQENTSKE